MPRACETVCACKRRRALQGRQRGMAIPCKAEQQRQAARKTCNRVRSVVTPIGGAPKGKNRMHSNDLIECNKRSTKESRIMQVIHSISELRQRLASEPLVAFVP